MLAEDGSATDPPETVGRIRTVPAWVQRVGLVSWYFVGTAAAATILVLSLAAVRDLVVPLVVSAFLAVSAVPLVDRLERAGLRRSLAAAATVATIYGVIIVCGVLVGLGLADQSDELSESLREGADTVRGYVDEVSWMTSLVDHAENNADTGLSVARDGVATQMARLLDSTIGLFAGVFISLFLMYYLLKDGRQLASGLAQSSDPGVAAQNEQMLNRAARHFRAHFRGRSILAAIDGVFIGLGMAVLGVPLALAIGVVNFVGAYIPYFGAFIGGAFAFLMALSTGDLALAVYSLVLVLIVQNVLENAVEPRIMGDSLAMHPLTVMVVTTIGGIVAGIVGLIVAAPVYAVARDYLGGLVTSGFFDEVEEAESV